MHIFKAVLIAFAVVGASHSIARADIMIDDFTTTQTVNAPTGGFNPVVSNITSGAALKILGDQRDVVVERVIPGGTGNSGVTTTFSAGTAAFPENSKIFSDGAPSVDGYLRLTYDGSADESDGESGDPGVTNTLDATLGLGGIDLTEGNSNSAFVFVGLKNSGTTDVTGRITVYSSATDYSTRNFLIVDEIFGGNTGTAIVSFNTFVTASGSGADFSDVRAIVFEFDLNSATGSDLEIDDLMAGGPVGSELPVPEPASIALLAIGIFGLVGYAIRRKRKELLNGVAA